RIVMVLQGKSSVYDTDLFDLWRPSIHDLWQPVETDERLLCDHLRSTVVVVGDGVTPSNLGRGYVLRRIVRRILTTLWRQDPGRSLRDLPPGPVDSTFEQFRLDQTRDRWRTIVWEEEDRFRKLLTRGRPVVGKLLSRGPLTEP